MPINFNPENSAFKKVGIRDMLLNFGTGLRKITDEDLTTPRNRSPEYIVAHTTPRGRAPEPTNFLETKHSKMKKDFVAHVDPEARLPAPNELQNKKSFTESVASDRSSDSKSNSR